MFGKRGQAGNIATLISLIALFMLVYILLLPQEARDELLDRENGKTRISPNSENDIKILFSKFVGDVSPLKQSKGITHTIAGVNLYSNIENEIITLAEELLIMKGTFSENFQTLDFPLDYPKGVKKAELYTLIGNSEGNLIVDLNGRQIFNADVQSNSQELIQLPLADLEEINTITLSSSGGFLSTGRHELKDIRLRKQVEVKNRMSERTISIPATELKDLEKAILSFSVYCSHDENDLLKVLVNGNTVYSDVPFCNLRRVEIEVDESFAKDGANTLTFESDGDYVIEEVEWQSLLRGERESEYAFNIDEEDYTNARRGISHVFLVFEFALSDERKIFDFYVNDKKFEINTLNADYTIEISDFLEDGNNLMRLRPRNSFEIIDMRVELE